MKNSKISEAYSSALINIFMEKGILISILPDIQLFYEVLTKDYIHSVANNGTQQEKKEWIDEIFKSWLPNYWMTTMYLLIDKNLFHIIGDITIDFLEKGYEIANISFGFVYSAIHLTEKEFVVITKNLQRRLKRKVILTNEIDKSLIAGIRIEIENRIYDNSLLGVVKQLRNLALKKIGSW